MRWKTTISCFSVLVFFLLLLFCSDKTSENSESDGRENSERGGRENSERDERRNSESVEKKAGVKLYHGMNKRYWPGDEPDMQINITVHSNQMDIYRTYLPDKYQRYV